MKEDNDNVSSNGLFPPETCAATGHSVADQLAHSRRKPSQQNPVVGSGDSLGAPADDWARRVLEARKALLFARARMREAEREAADWRKEALQRKREYDAVWSSAGGNTALSDPMPDNQ